MSRVTGDGGFRATAAKSTSGIKLPPLSAGGSAGLFVFWPVVVGFYKSNLTTDY